MAPTPTLKNVNVRQEKITWKVFLGVSLRRLTKTSKVLPSVGLALLLSFAEKRRTSVEVVAKMVPKSFESYFDKQSIKPLKNKQKSISSETGSGNSP